MRAYFPGPRAIESTVAIAAASSPPLSRAESRFNAQADSIQRYRITQAVVEVIAHGPYPISFLQNPGRLNFVCPDFMLHSRRTVTKKLDDFLDAEKKSQCGEMHSNVDTASLSWDDWTSKA